LHFKEDGNKCGLTGICSVYVECRDIFYSRR